MKIGESEGLAPASATRMRSVPLRIVASALCTLFAVFEASCTAVEGTGCDTSLTVKVEPTSQALRVGESFTPVAHALSCGGTQELQQTWTWRSGDSTIVGTDSRTGRTAALKIGSTTVQASGVPYPANVFIVVTVIP